MDFVRKCPKCAQVLTDPAAQTCPACGASLAVRTRGNIWIGALIQFVMAGAFMLIFHFPKILITVFGVMILAGTFLATFLKARPAAQPAPPQKQSALYQALSVGIALCALAIFSILLFGVVMFANDWTRWHQYEGQPFHRSEFQVTRAYYQKQSKSYDVSANGVVEGHQEWMNLRPYLFSVPHNQAEIEKFVPAGTRIPIYFFPGMKGRARVQFDTDDPPAEASRRQAFETLHNSLVGLTIAIPVLFVFVWIRRACRSTPVSNSLQSPFAP